ncbi:hypothetical protein B484DRAFT_423902, partial [Ochromonadaceae sp. CCMP2298]
MSAPAPAPTASSRTPGMQPKGDVKGEGKRGSRRGGRRDMSKNEGKEGNGREGREGKVPEKKKSKGRGGGGGSGGRKPPTLHRILLRRLPVDFSLSDAQAALNRICAHSNGLLDIKSFRLEHVVGGKMSRKRGPVFGAVFLSADDAVQYSRFLALVPAWLPFVLEEGAGG